MGTTARGTTRTLPSKIAGGVCIELCTLKFYGKPANLIVVKVLLVEWLETCLHSRVTCAETHLFGRSCTLATLSKAAGGIWRVSFATDPTLELERRHCWLGIGMQEWNRNRLPQVIEVVLLQDGVECA